MSTCVIKWKASTEASDWLAQWKSSKQQSLWVAVINRDVVKQSCSSRSRNTRRNDRASCLRFSIEMMKKNGREHEFGFESIVATSWNEQDLRREIRDTRLSLKFRESSGNFYDAIELDCIRRTCLSTLLRHSNLLFYI